MSNMTAEQVLDRHYLEIRCGMLSLAASLDRIDRNQGAEQARQDPRMTEFHKALEILASDGDDRAERIQLLFSDPYVEGWNQ